MAKILNLKAPDSMELHKMDPEEIERYVADMAGEAFERLPEGVKPSRVSAVSLNQAIPSADWEGWVEWTRACADQRTKIEDYSDPLVDEIDRGAPEGQRLASQLRIQQRASREQG